LREPLAVHFRLDLDQRSAAALEAVPPVDKRALTRIRKHNQQSKTKAERLAKNLYFGLICAFYRLNDLNITGG
jgi:hypothetical protein